MPDLTTTAPPILRRKPTRAETARANGARSRGPATEEGRARSSRNALAHGLRARRWLAIPALGEDPAEAAAHFAAVRAELGAAGPIARHLAETAASGVLRAARADRLEGELLAGLAEGGRSVAKLLHDDRDARAALVLLHRYRREADGDLRRALDTLLRLHRARADGLLPDADEAEDSRATLDDSLAGLTAPSEPRTVRIVPVQPVRPRPANDDRPPSPAPARPAAALAPPPRVSPPAPPPQPEPPPALTGDRLLRQHRWYKTEAERARFLRRLTPEWLALLRAAEEEERRGAAGGGAPTAPAGRCPAPAGSA